MGALPRGRQPDHAGRVGRHQVRLHLRGGGQAQGNAQENHLHQGHAAAQRDLQWRRLSNGIDVGIVSAWTDCPMTPQNSSVITNVSWEICKSLKIVTNMADRY